ncbi:MAG: nucleotidyltransferase family protein [Nanoarchaeota archaeon]|nr:nucleotidyltransferase family protein [Nanoarchaeota archaeon]
MYPKTAIILAGGVGERLRPLTLATPKPLLPINDKPILAHTIENLKNQNIKNIILAVGYKAEKIKEFLGDGKKFGVNIQYLIEEQPLGTGGATKLASQGIKETFLVLNGDNLSDFNYKKMSEIHEKNKAKITIALYPVDDVTKFGIAELNGDQITRFIEKPSKEEAPTNLNNAGAYFIEPKVLDLLPEGKCSIEKDCFEKLTQGVYAYQHPSQWFPTDDLNKYLIAQKKWQGLK